MSEFKGKTYRIGGNRTTFIERLREEGFDYSKERVAVTYPGVAEEVANLTWRLPCFLIIPTDDEKRDSQPLKNARQRLRDLADKF
jgi:hypothetical protein